MRTPGGGCQIGATPGILQGSLRRVLTPGCSDRPADSALEALARAEGLGPMLDRLGGLNGTVREGGRNLTRSERPALSLMRAALQGPRLILVRADCDASVLRRLASLEKRHAAIVISQVSLTQPVMARV